MKLKVTFADAMAILALGDSVKLQSALIKVVTSAHIDFTNKKIKQQKVVISDTESSYTDTPKHPDMLLDRSSGRKSILTKKEINLTSNSENVFVSWS